MTRRINKIQMVDMAIIRIVIQGYALCLDGNATFPLDIHRIKHLCRHFTLTERTTQLYKTISQRRLAMIHMGNN